MIILPEIRSRLSQLSPQIKAKGDLIRELTDLHVLRECHVPRQQIDTRSLAVAGTIVREAVDFEALSELDQDIWVYAIAGYIACRIRELQRSKRIVH